MPGLPYPTIEPEIRRPFLIDGKSENQKHRAPGTYFIYNEGYGCNVIEALTPEGVPKYFHKG